MAKPMKTLFLMEADSRSLKEPWWNAHWRHLLNTTKRSVRGDDVALRQITLTNIVLQHVKMPKRLIFPKKVSGC